MAWVAVNQDGNESIHEIRPQRAKIQVWLTYHGGVNLPKGSIKKLIGRELTWQDEPVELK